MSSIIVTVDKPAYGGLSIGRHEGKVVMLSGSPLRGEVIEASIQRDRRDFLQASLTRIVEPSPHRIEPPCPYYGKCGGCHYQHISYQEQVAYKEEILRDCLKRLAGIDHELGHSITAPSPLHYRIRGQFKVREGIIGYFRARSRDIVDIENCLLLTPALNEYLKKIGSCPLPRSFRELHISTDEDASALLIRASVPSEEIKKLDPFVSPFLELGFAGGYVQTEDEQVFAFGDPFLTISLGKVDYSFSPLSFIQSNPECNRALVRTASGLLEPLKGKRILDLYAGGGNFSLPLALEAGVDAVEENPHAVQDGRRNVALNGLETLHFHHCSAEEFQGDTSYDAVILDPPRPGLTEKAVHSVLAMEPEIILYISCNPATFARDLRKFLRKYKIESIQMADLFPQTFHVEVIALLQRR